MPMANTKQRRKGEKRKLILIPKKYFIAIAVCLVIASLVVFAAQSDVLASLKRKLTPGVNPATLVPYLNDPAKVAQLLSAVHAEKIDIPELGKFSFPYPPSPKPSMEEFKAISDEAGSGDAKSQLYMGIFHANGDVVEQDYGKAAEWYEKAAKQGNARAQYYLGNLYECGLGVERDYAAAFEWYRRSVEQNNPAAHLAIAGFHFAYRFSYMPVYFGNYDVWRAKAFFLAGVESGIPSFEERFWGKVNSRERYSQNDKLVVEEMHARAKNGDGAAALQLGKMALHAQGIAREWKLGNTLVHIAAEQGDPNAAFILCATYEGNRLITISMTQDVRLRYLAIAAQDGKNPLFTYYYHQQLGGVTSELASWLNRNPLQGSVHYRELERMAEEGNLYAQCLLSKWKIAAAEQGDHYTQANVGMGVLYGEFGGTDYVVGKAWLDKAIQGPDASVVTNISVAFKINGEFKPTETIAIAHWLYGLYKSGDSTAALYLGMIMRNEDIQKTLNGDIEGDSCDWYIRATASGIHQGAILLQHPDIQKNNKTIPFGKLGISKKEISLYQRAMYLSNNLWPLLCIPGAKNDYGPAMLDLFDSFLRQSTVNDIDALRNEWLGKIVFHPKWFSIKSSTFDVTDVLWRMYSNKLDQNEIKKIPDNDSFLLHYRSFVIA